MLIAYRAIRVKWISRIAELLTNKFLGGKMELLDWFAAHKEVMAVGIVLLGGGLTYMFGKKDRTADAETNNTNTNNNSVVVNLGGNSGGGALPQTSHPQDVKDKTYIMFVD